MSKAIVNALTLALLEGGIGNTDINFATSKAFAEEFVAENAELFIAPAQLRGARGDAAPASKPRTAYELSEQQEEAIAAGVKLCPNCQQPVTDHLPGCSRAFADPNDPFLKGAVTKNKLNPVA